MKKAIMNSKGVAFSESNFTHGNMSEGVLDSVDKFLSSADSKIYT